MELHEYIAPMSRLQKINFAARAGTTLGMLFQVSNGFKRASVGEHGSTMLYCKASDWRVTPHDLRPDVYPKKMDGIPARVLARLVTRA